MSVIVREGNRCYFQSCEIPNMIYSRQNCVGRRRRPILQASPILSAREIVVIFKVVKYRT